MKTKTPLTPEEQIRYQRQTVLEMVGEEGQLKLKSASVLCVGAGGLASSALQYLAAAGVGRIGIIDHDVVDVSNLQRQVLFSNSDVGTSKVASAKARLLAINPGIIVDVYFEKFDVNNAEKILSDYEAVIDATDNFSTRYLINDVAIKQGKLNFFASVNQFSGQVAVFCAESGCYRCVFAEPPLPELAPNCNEAGVIGVLPGIMGAYQALEFIKWKLGIGSLLKGTLLNFDLLTNDFHTLKFSKNPDCTVCKKPSNIQLGTYSDYCSTDKATEISASEVRQKINHGENFRLVDVREEDEHNSGNLGGVSLPLSQLFNVESNEVRIRKLIGDTDQTLVLYCLSGSRSAQAVQILHRLGYADVFNLRGGINSWNEKK